jgi:hypothetical protein
LSDTDTDTGAGTETGTTPSWQLPPAAGQYGYKPPERQTIREQNAPPYGFRRTDPSGVPPFNPYVPTYLNPALRDRPHTDWGTDDWVLAGMRNYPDGGMPEGMHVPTEQDIPGLIHGLVTGMGRWAAPRVAMPMIQAGMQFNAGNANFMKGYTQQANANRQQMLASMQLADYNHDLMINQYKNAYAEYAPDKDGKGGEPEELANRLREIAMENNDHNMLHLLDRGDMAGVDKLLKYLDSNGQDLKKAKEVLDYQIAQEKLKQTQEKTKQQEAQRSEWFGTTPPAAPSAAKPDAGQPAQPGAPDAQTPTSEKPDTASYQLPLAPPRISQAARDAQMGGNPALPKNDEIKSAVAGQREKLDDYMHHLVDDKSLTNDEVRARIRAANPAMDDEVQNLLDGRTVLTATASAKQSMQIAAALAGRLDPDWTTTAQKKKDQRELDARRAEIRPLSNTLGVQEKMRSNIRDTVVKNVRDMDYLLQLARRLKEKGLETQIPIIDGAIREGRRLVSGDPDVAAFDAQLRNVRTDVGRILSTGSSGTGAVYPVSVQKEMREFFDKGITVPQLEATIGVIKRDYSNKLRPITDEINSLNGEIARLSGTKPPELVSDDDIARELNADETQTIKGKTYYKRNGKWYDE